MKLKHHLGKLEYYCAIVEAGSLKKASEKVFIGQPQLTKVVQQLEETLGSTLLIRTPKGVSLTKAGAEFHRYCRQILEKADEAERSIKSKDKDVVGAVRIGTYDSISRYFFPDFLKYLRATIPGVKVFLETGRSKAIYKKLEQRSLDLAVIVSEPKRSSKTEFKRIYTDSFGLYQAPGMESVFSDTLIYFPFAMNETDLAMTKFGFTQSIVCDNLETVRSLTEQAIGVGLLPHRVAQESVLLRRLSPHTHPKIRRNDFDAHDIVLCHSKESLTPQAHHVLEDLQRFLLLWSQG